LIQTEGEEEALGVVVAPSIFDGQGIAPEPLDWVLLHVVLGDPERFEFLRKEQVAKSCGVGRKAVTVASISGLLVADLVHFVVGVVATACVSSDMAVRVSLASTIVTTTSSFASIVGGASAATATTTMTTATTPLAVAAL
jgi:hypothetical protein